jgi:hypothetical protein
MSAKAIYEADAKRLLSKYLQNTDFVKCQNALVTESEQWDDVVGKNEWITSQVSLQTSCGSKIYSNQSNECNEYK